MRRSKIWISQTAHAATSRSVVLYPALLSICQCLPSPSETALARVDILNTVTDVSSSTFVDDNCAEAAAKASEFLASREAERVEITVWGTGGRPSFEPIILFDGAFEERHAPFEGAASVESESAFVELLEKSCSEKIRPAKDSPIYLAIQRARSTLQARCVARSDLRVCSRRALAIMSDGRESVDPAVKRAITFPGDKNFSALKHRTLTPDKSIKISWCGVADSRARTRGNAAIESTWRIVLGEPDLLFSGACHLRTKD